jgi:hypothetical protein
MLAFLNKIVLCMPDFMTKELYFCFSSILV